MPPRKRVRVSQAASPSSPSQPKTPSPVNSPRKDEHLLNDPWTDEEELGLFKGLVRYKPTGIHKNFRLLSLHRFLLDNNYIDPSNEHTRPSGLWKKLHALYDLEALDTREDARQLSDIAFENADADDIGDDEGESDVYSEAENKIHNCNFRLPDDGYSELKWRRRFAPDEDRRNESPPLLPEINMADEAPVRFKPTFSVEPSEISGSFTHTRQGRASSSIKGKANTPNTSTRRSTRQAESVADDGDSVKHQDVSPEATDNKDDDGEVEEGPDSEGNQTPARSTRAGRSARERNSTVRGTRKNRRAK